MKIMKMCEDLLWRSVWKSGMGVLVKNGKFHTKATHS